MMACMSTMSNQHSYCGHFAAAGTSTHIMAILDTALLAVSLLFVLRLHCL